MKSLEERVSVLEVILSEKTASMEKAQRLQHEEYMRRLDDLNHEAERLRQMQLTYVPREVDAERGRKIESSIKTLEAFRNNFIGKVALIAGGAAVLAGLLASVVTALVIRAL